MTDKELLDEIEREFGSHPPAPKNDADDLDAFLADVDMVVVMVKHNEIREQQDKLAGKIVLDCQNVIKLPNVYHI